MGFSAIVCDGTCVRPRNVKNDVVRVWIEYKVDSGCTCAICVLRVNKEPECLRVESVGHGVVDDRDLGDLAHPPDNKHVRCGDGGCFDWDVHAKKCFCHCGADRAFDAHVGVYAVLDACAGWFWVWVISADTACTLRGHGALSRARVCTWCVLKTDIGIRVERLACPPPPTLVAVGISTKRGGLWG